MNFRFETFFVNFSNCLPFSCFTETIPKKWKMIRCISVGWFSQKNNKKQLWEMSECRDVYWKHSECQGWRDLQTPLQFNHAISSTSPIPHLIVSTVYVLVIIVNLGCRKYCKRSWHFSNYTLTTGN
jgi:hypothetical protein